VLEETFQQFSKLGLKLQITKLDISVYPKEHDARERKTEDAHVAFTPEKEVAQLEVYKMCFELFRKYKDQISGITFWNISDRRSWLDDFPVRGRKDYPLLFDKDLKPKKAFWEVVLSNTIENLNNNYVRLLFHFQIHFASASFNIISICAGAKRRNTSIQEHVPPF
jgi:GH35 family endo-1,4-beta-xylanase